MSVGTAEIESAPASTVIQLAIILCVWQAAKRNSLALYPAEHVVKEGIIHVKRVMMALEVSAFIEVKRECVVHSNRCKVAVETVIGEAENAGNELGCSNLVIRRNDRVVQRDRHSTPPWLNARPMW